MKKPDFSHCESIPIEINYFTFYCRSHCSYWKWFSYQINYSNVVCILKTSIIKQLIKGHALLQVFENNYHFIYHFIYSSFSLIIITDRFLGTYLDVADTFLKKICCSCLTCKNISVLDTINLYALIPHNGVTQNKCLYGFYCQHLYTFFFYH